MTKYFLTGTTTAALLIFAFVMAGRACVLHQARTVIDEIGDLDNASDTTAASLSFMQEHQKHLASKTCDREFCQYQFVFTNRLLSTFHLATPSEIEVFVSVYQKRLEHVDVDLTSDTLKENRPVVHVQEDFCKYRTDIRCEHFAINPHGRDATQTWNGNLLFGQLVKEDQERAAWALNVDCLKALRGCQDISELNPAIWKRTSSNKVSGRMRSTADSIAEGAQRLPD